MKLMVSAPIKIPQPSRPTRTCRVRLNAACGIVCRSVCLSAAGQRAAELTCAAGGSVTRNGPSSGPVGRRRPNVTAAALAVQLLGRGSIATEYVRRCAQPVSNVLTPQLFILPWRQRSLVNLRLHESPHIGVGQDAALNFGATTGRRAGDVFATGHLPGVITSTVRRSRSPRMLSPSRKRRRGLEPSKPPTDRGEDGCAIQSANLAGHAQQTLFPTSLPTRDIAAMADPLLRRSTPMSGGRDW